MTPTPMPDTTRILELDDWIEEHRREIAECPATVRGYRKANSLQWGLNRLLEYRATLSNHNEVRGNG
jgi:hypothetical protein